MDSMGSTGMEESSGSTLDSLVIGLILLLIKLLVIALIIVAVIGICLWLKKTFFRNFDISQYIRKNPMSKPVLEIFAIIIGLVILISLYNYLVGPTAGNQGDMAGNAASHMNGGFSGALALTGVFSFIIKVLTYVFVITLIIGLFAYFKKLIRSSGFKLNSIFEVNSDKSPANQDNSAERKSNTEDGVKSQEGSAE